MPNKNGFDIQSLIAKHLWDWVKEGTTAFTIEEIAVRCWNKDPHRFGMTGFLLKYPDLHRVSAAMAGKRGMVARGLLRRTVNDQGRVLYGITENMKEDKKWHKQNWWV